jgi:hypothetical protein
MELTDNLIKNGAGHDSHPQYCITPQLESETNTSTVSTMFSVAQVKTADRDRAV